MDKILQLAQRGGKNLHRSQGGAVILLVLAGFLILVLATMMMFDAGNVTRDKTQLQTAADTAAYSQAVIKARTMNMVTYANIAKRVFYSYVYTYWAAWQALIASWIMYKADCFKIWPNPYACKRWAVGLVQIIVQGVEMIAGDLPLINGRTKQEVQTLENYQKYMIGITPWWAYAENLLRGAYNGATVTAAWPPPPATIPNVWTQIENVVRTLDSIFGSTFLADYFPDRGGKTDSMPLKKRSGIMGHTGYCAEFIGSAEHVMSMAEHLMQSDSGAKGISRDTQTTGIFAANSFIGVQNCIIASFFLGDNVLDYRVGDMLSSPSLNDWMQDTSNITIAYQAGAYRSNSRAQTENLLNDHAELSLFEAEGYWSLARSEIVYGDSPASAALDGFVPGLGDVLAIAQGPISAIVGGPNMWTPRWTGKLRPLHLPGESLGKTTVRSEDIGLGAIFLDVVSHMAITGTIAGLLDSEFSFNAALNDLAYFYMASAGYNGDRLQGLSQ